MDKQSKILIIEDEVSLLKSLTEVLEERGYEVVGATDGESGLRLAQERNPDLIILDLLLPGMDGVDVLRQLRENKETEGIPVLVLTNLSDEKTVAEVLAVGGKDYLVKSDVNLEMIANKVEEILARGRPAAKI